MCRFIVYRGPERLLADWLIRPANSLIKQSYHAREMPEPLNGDGFGAGWYSSGDDPTPCLFTSVTPAWSNRNLRRLAVRIRSACWMAHVRAATPGSVVSEQNCHPFRHGRFLWMHNGRIAGFERIMRRLRRELRDDLYASVRGTTDSEHAFYLFLNRLGSARQEVCRQLGRDPAVARTYCARYLDLLHDGREVGAPQSDEALVDSLAEHLGEFPEAALEQALLGTLGTLARWTRDAGVTAPSFCNFAATDGRTILVTRYADQEGVEPPSLYYTAGLTTADDEGHVAPAIVICSEPLTDLHEGWHPIPRNHLLAVGADWAAELRPIPPPGLHDTIGGV